MSEESNTEQTVPVAGHWLVSLAQLDDQQKYIAGLRPRGELYGRRMCRKRQERSFDD